MSTRVADQVNSWDDRSFGGGYRELQDLADDEFSGVVRAGGAELYMTRGVVVGIQRGDIADFQTGGTIYQSPTDALPLLAIMQERSDEVRAKYYTEDTSISKVDKTLSDGGFTGFIELSENVLSGDYYLVYHAGTSMSVAYVGNSGQLLDGDEAFETADDEVGIYEVRPVDIDPIDIPEPDDDPGAAAAGAPDAGVSGDELDDEPAPESTEEATEPAEPAAETVDDPEPEPAAETTTATADDTGPDPEPAADPSPQQSGAGERTAAESTSTTAERETAQPDSTPPAQSSQRQERQPTGQQRNAESADSATQRNATSTNQQRRERGTNGTSAGQTGRARQTQPPTEPRTDQRSQQTEQTSRQDVETKSIPSLDPDQTSVPDTASEPADSPTPTAVSDPATDPEPEPTPEPTPASEPRESTPERTEPRQQTRAEPEPAPQQRAEPTAPAPDPEPAPGVDPERVEELEADLSEKDEEIDRLETELDSVSDERDDLEAELETLREERDDLQAEVEELRDELRRLEEELGAATDAERRLSADEALAGTDIFVRYRSKGQATLEKAHGSSTRKQEVNENLRLEKHTQFDADTVAVGGQSYHEFLESTLEYQFVRWVVRELLFEIRDTGHQKALSDLYDVLPRVDRAELAGVIEVTYTEDGQETQSQEGFDVVLRDRMGNPLLAANLNDTREATTESMMERLITAAERVGQSTDGFSGAFLVTESFFDPGALEIASDATQGGLLSRDKRKSFVNLSRKRGYHLCLVEARNENFHLAVPEL